MTTSISTINNSTINTSSINAYGEHIAKLSRDYSAAINCFNAGVEGKQASGAASIPVEAVLLHSGSEQHYFADDRGIPFQAYGHFLHWLPVNRPDQFVYFRAGEKPTYFQIVPDDFWYDQTIEMADHLSEQFTVVRLTSVNELGAQLKSSALAFLGERADLASSLGIDQALVNPRALIAYLDFCRATKTDYALEQLRAANKTALQGHAAARLCFLNGGNEYQIHSAYLNACAILEGESPYTNIVALNERSAILHYQYKRREDSPAGQVLLIDAGCRVNGYGSDITRTSVSDDVHPVFRALLGAMENLQQALVSQIKPQLAYQELHESALRSIGAALIEHGICMASNSVEALMAQNIPQLFMPHGVGHLLGIQVHDVGGHQINFAGSISAPPAHSPALRNTRIMTENMVFTVEPGLYFIPLLLEPQRNSSRGKTINWKLVDELYACGGIRIEDNVRVTREGVENLTRQFE